MDPLEASIKRFADYAVEIAARLVRIPSDGPAHDERSVVAALSTEAAMLGLPPGEVIAAEAIHPNLLIRVRAATPGRRLILTSHTDTKPPGDEADPRSGDIRAGRLYGLGSADAKGSVAAMLVAAAALRAADLPAAGELLLVFSADEESEGSRGLAYIASTGALAADAAIVGEPSGMDAGFDGLPVLARGFVGFGLRANGPRLHSGLVPRSGVGGDPLAVIARAVADLPALVHVPPATGGPHADADTPSRLTFTSIGGGLADGILANSAWARGEVRTMPGQTRDAVAAAIRDALSRLGGGGDGAAGSIDLDVDAFDWPASFVDPSAAIVTALAAATELVTGRRPPIGAFPGATEAHVLANLGIPTVLAFGPGLLAAAHVPGESVAADELRAAVAIYARTAAAYLS
ncbi:MAG: M20/M25/M40 family metallo-hydrolase [Chloroflexota bacterium]|nr:M20/M25/M40 family metallo-hydrolase [Chloroflexota bacterium]